jgi:serine/threonine protein kinase
VKRLKPIGDLPDIIVRYFTREMQLMSGLKQHRNVLRLLAYCDEASERILVYEYIHAQEELGRLHIWYWQSMIKPCFFLKKKKKNCCLDVACVFVTDRDT